MCQIALCDGAVALAAPTELHYRLTPSPLRTQGLTVRHRLGSVKFGRLGGEGSGVLFFPYFFVLIGVYIPVRPHQEFVVFLWR
jgi:hypothetical protein